MTEFPQDFFWGAATSSYQIEGAFDEGGRSLSIWDVFCRRPGVVFGGHSGDRACDHYNRFRDDISLFRQIGLQAYRFSISWSRVLPSGTGDLNAAGLDFYSSLVDELLEAGIRPFVTLFHWDLPLALHQRGGWQNRDSADWFGEYAAIVVRRLGDRVSDWMTLNEPQVIIESGYETARFAPGERQQRSGVLNGAHNLLRAHGQAVQAIRAESPRASRVGWAPVCVTLTPASNDPRDVEAARTAMFSADMGAGGWTVWNNAWWMDPVLKGQYPDDGLIAAGRDAPHIRDGDLTTISQPIDFIGTNIYHGQPVRARVDGTAEVVMPRPGYAQTRMDWTVTPESLYWGPRFLHERYGMPMVITENGVSCHDWVSRDGLVHDPQRVDFIARYVAELRRAVADGVPVLGYLYWSAMDNFEWERGYQQRFGLIYVDFETQKRVLKDSARWYAALIKSNGASLPLSGAGL